MLAQKIKIEPYAIRFNKKTTNWYFFEFLLSPQTQALWCQNWSKKCVFITLSLPESLISQINASIHYGSFKDNITHQLKTILIAHDITIIGIQINNTYHYLNHDWIIKKLKQLITFLIIINIGLILSHYPIRNNQKKHLERRQAQQQQSILQKKTELKLSQTHNQKILQKFHQYLSIPKLYIQSLNLYPAQLELTAIYQTNNEPSLLTQLWQTTDITSQHYTITPLKNNWKKIHYVWQLQKDD